MHDRHVYAYWQGNRPSYIDLCMRTIRQNCYRSHFFHLIDAGNIESALEGVHDNWRNIVELGVVSDVVRAACLAKTGGWYLDADTVLLKELPEIPEGVDAAYVQWSQSPHRIVAGNIYVSREVGQKWLANVNAKLAAGKWGWTELGEGCITPVIDALPDDQKWRMPLESWFPIEIDLNKGKGSARFFQTGSIDNLLAGHTLGVGLNNSWFQSRPQAKATYRRINQGDFSDGTFLSSVMQKAADSIRQPHVTVCCPTYRRPQLLGQMIRCFENQGYDRVSLIGYDESMTSGISNSRDVWDHDRGWMILAGKIRPETLGKKRNIVSTLAQDLDFCCPDILVPWDDDDLYLPHALQAIVDALQWADFARPSQILVPGPNRSMKRYETFWRKDQLDKACHPAWGYTVGAFRAVGGYPEELSHGEDLGLAKRFLEAGVSECDPIALGHEPYLLYGPHDNEHFGWTHKNYDTWPKRLKAQAGEVVPVDPDWDLNTLNIAPGPAMKRSFTGDWYNSDQR